MLGVVGQQCCVRLHGAKSLTISNFAQQLPTKRKNMQQSAQTDATCDIQQRCVRLYAALVALDLLFEGPEFKSRSDR